MRIRRLIREEYEERIKKRYCPRCKTYSLVNVEINNYIDLPLVRHKFIHSFWKCSGPHGFLCYFLSSDKGTTIFESFTGVKPVEYSNEEPVIQNPTVIRRTKESRKS
jgi:hypothetical protein